MAKFKRRSNGKSRYNVGSMVRSGYSVGRKFGTAYQLGKKVVKSLRNKFNRPKPSAPSKTITNTQKKTKPIRIGGGQLSESFTKLGTKSRLNSQCRKLPLVNADQVDSVGITSTYNTQGVSVPAVVANQVQFLNFFTTASQYGVTGTFPVPQTGAEDFRYVIRSTDLEIILSNQSADLCEVTIYDLIAKSNQTGAALAPDTCWNNGVADVDGPAINNNKYIYAVPWKYKYFTDRFWIKKIQTVYMGGGGYHRHRFKHQINKVYSSEYLNTFSVYRGLTTYIMVTVKGMPHDQALGGTTTGTALTPIKLDCLVRYNIAGSQLTVNARQDYFKNNLATTTPTALYGYVPQINPYDFMPNPVGPSVVQTILQAGEA